MILAAWQLAILAFFFAAVAIFLMIVILLQRGKGVGLAGAFGGAGGGAAFGAKTGDVMTWGTVVLAVVLLIFAVVLNRVYDAHHGSDPGLDSTTGGTDEGAWHLEDPASGVQLARGLIFGESAA
ncbi:MAG: preprotein translocase subunit SecG [Phycisphaerae bacterium]|nr:preprotein translocase subunit SecG [Phycisphaerae bacterium]